jgi:hypothetical protein
MNEIDHDRYLSTKSNRMLLFYELLFNETTKMKKKNLRREKKSSWRHKKTKKKKNTIHEKENIRDFLTEKNRFGEILVDHSYLFA